METLQDLLPRIAKFGGREAVRWTDGLRTVVSSYDDLYSRIGAIVAFFDEHGITKGDRVLVRGENRMEWIAAFWACVAHGDLDGHIVYPLLPQPGETTQPVC